MGKKEILIYNPHSNKEVTSYYIYIISSVFIEMGYSVKNINLLCNCVDNYNKYIIIIDLKDVIEAKKYGFKNIIYWIQGVAPEEIYLKKKDILRYLLYSYREYKALRSSKFIFFCSENMKRHYEKKYKYYIDKYYIMPCFNEELHFDEILKKKYENNDFIYAGSLEKWQNFEETVSFYKKIEERVENVNFKVFVKDRIQAKKILEKYKIKNYVIDFVKPQELTKEILQSKFGFCLRKNITVNLVATPTKLSNYIANGVLPIYSECLNGFYSQAKNSQYCINADDQDALQKIVELCNKKLDGIRVAEDFKKCFCNYYSAIFHREEIKKLFLKLGIN